MGDNAMSIIEAIILGLVQGFTEFLPVSSSGHLVIFQHLLGVNQPPLVFDSLVHLGTLGAVAAIFRDDIWAILKNPFSKLPWLIVAGCIPAVIIGFGLEPYFEKAFESLVVVGVGLLITGTVLAVTERIAARKTQNKTWDSMTWGDALLVGLMQGIAITPGISRSGMTIAGSLLRGLDRGYAARFSFLLSIPVIFGAAVLQIKDFPFGSLTRTDLAPYIIGPVVACFSGYAAIRIVLKFLQEGRLHLFAYYCWALGLAVLASQVLF